MVEIWKDIKGYEGYYQVSNMGRVKSLARKVKTSNRWGKMEVFVRERIMIPNVKKGYYAVPLSKNGTYHYYLVHRLVAEAFIPNPDNLPQVNHKDENKTNNKIGNLEWCDPQYNLNYGTRNKRISIKKKQNPTCLSDGVPTVHNN